MSAFASVSASASAAAASASDPEALASDPEALARIIVAYLMSQILNPDGSKNSYCGNIPLNLDDPRNMGAKALEQCHPALSISWMQFLAQLTFTISWKDNVPTVVMNYYGVLGYDTHNYTCEAQCPLSLIQQKILDWGMDTPEYKTIRALVYDVFQNIMIELTKILYPDPECVCLAIWDIPPHVEYKAITNESTKRKHDDVEY